MPNRLTTVQLVEIKARNLLRDVEGSASSSWMDPVASKHFSKDRIVRLLQSPWLLIESRQVPLEYRLHSSEWVFFEDSSTVRKMKKIIQTNIIINPQR